MLEIMIMYGAVASIFVVSLVIGFIKSTRAVLILGGLLTIAAIACGIFMRNYELRTTVLDYVKTNGDSVFATPSEWGNMKLLGIGVIVAIVVLGGICFALVGKKAKFKGKKKRWWREQKLYWQGNVIDRHGNEY